MKRPCEKRCVGEMFCMWTRCFDCIDRPFAPLPNCDECKSYAKAKRCVDERKAPEAAR